MVDFHKTDLKPTSITENEFQELENILNTPIGAPPSLKYDPANNTEDHFKELESLIGESRPEPGYLKTAAKGLARGTEGMLSGAGSVVRWLGDVTHEEAMSKAGKWFSDYWNKAAQEGWEAPDPRIFRGDFMENPSLKRAVGIVGEAVPSLLAALGIGVLTGGGSVGAAAAAGSLGLLEGAPQYEEAREAGKTVGESSAVGLISTAGTALLEFLPIGHMMKGMKGGRIVQGLLGGFEEGLQETTQTVFQNLVAKIGYDDTRALFEGVVESFIGGFGSGAVASPTVQKLNDVLQKHAGKLTDKDVDDVNNVVTDNIQAAAEKVRNTPKTDTPVEEDLERYEASKGQDPLGDDSIAKDIIDKIAAGRMAPVATTPRGQGADQLKAELEELEEGIKQPSSKVSEEIQGDSLEEPPAQASASNNAADLDVGVPAPENKRVADFVRSKVTNLGSVEAVEAFYDSDDKVSKYAKAYAKRLFNVPLSSDSVSKTPKSEPQTDLSVKNEPQMVHDHSSTQVDFPEAEANKVREYAAKIPDAELYEDPKDPSYGREDSPHITVRYGMDTLDPAEIAPAFEGMGPITATLGEVSIFEADDYDVVKVDIESDTLREANKRVGDTVDLPGETFTDYKPHATIAYVKKGEGKKYVGDKTFEGKEITFDSITLSARDGKNHTIELAGEPSKNEGVKNLPPLASTKVETVDTIAGPLTISDFEKEKNPRHPWEVTRNDWVNIQRAERRRLGQEEGGDNKNAPFAEYEEYHRDSVEDAFRAGKNVPPEVLRDYPDISHAIDNTKKPLTKKEKALAEYQELVGGLTDEQRTALGDLVQENPKSPSMQAVKISKALAEAPATPNVADATPNVAPEIPTQIMRGGAGPYDVKMANEPERPALYNELVDLKTKAESHGDKFPRGTMMAINAQMRNLENGSGNGGVFKAIIDEAKEELAKLEKPAKTPEVDNTGDRPVVKAKSTPLTEPAPKANNESLANVSADDLLAEWDRQAAEAEQPKKPETLKERREKVQQRQKQNAENVREAAKQPTEARKAAREKAKETKQHLGNALDALKQINGILGKTGEVGPDADVDPRKWDQIRPLLKLAWDEMLAAGKSAKEFVALAIQTLSPAGRPYFQKFVREELSNERTDSASADEISSSQGLRSNGEDVQNRPQGPGERTAGDTGEGGPVREETGEEPTGAEQPGTRGAGLESGSTPGRPGRGSTRSSDVSGSDRVGGRTGRESSAESNLAPEDRNHVIAPDDEIVPRGVEGKIKANISAIQLLKKLEEEDRNPTPDEKKILAKYVGWGAFSQKIFNKEFDRLVKSDQTPSDYYQYNKDGLKKFEEWKRKYGDMLHPALGGLMTEEEWKRAEISTINAHYTSRDVINSMWSLAKRLGFKGGTILEPAAGVGHFFGLMPAEISAKSTLFGVELDTLSGKILKKLYPQAHVEITGFQKARSILDNSIDMTITNVPFADVPVTDKRHPDYSGWNLHNYFLARALTATKPGGLMLAISSNWSLDAKSNGKVRDYMGSKADLVGAIRLPNTAFKENAGTEVVTDILVFRKKDTNAVGLGAAFRASYPIETAEYKQDLAELEKARGDLATFQNNKLPANAKAPVKKAWNQKNKELKERVQKALDKLREAHPVNEYFHKNPDMVLGKHAMTGTMYASNTYTVEPTDDMYSLLRKAIEAMPEDIAGEGTDLSKLEKVQIADLSDKEGTLVLKDGIPKLVHNGRIVQPFYIGSKGEEMRVNTVNKVMQLKKYVGVRDLTADVIRQLGDEATTDEQVKVLQAKLNKAYDDFVGKYGHFNDVKNSFLRKIDNDFAVVDALEVEVGKGKERKIVKAQIFTTRTIFPFVEPSNAASLEDAANLSIIYRGELQPVYVAELLGENDLDAVKKMLVDEGHGFINPDTGRIEQADLYLSGNVKKKLAAAKLAAEQDPSYKPNVEALEKVIPEDIDMEFISFRMSSSWIPAGAVQSFFKEFLEVDTTVDKVDTGMTTNWHIGVTGNEQSVKNRKTWGSSDYTAIDLADMQLNMRHPKVMVSEYSGGKRVTYEDKEASKEAALKMKELSEEFVTWAKTHTEWAPKMARVYNDEKNGTVLRKHREPNIDVYPGASPVNAEGKPLRLRPHQKIAVSRGLQESVLLAYGVGTGKTFILITTAMEMRRIGTARKPIIVVHNQTIDQYRNSFKLLYPGAKVLIPDDKQRDAKYRRKTLISMATGDWDAIVLPQSFFDGIANDPARETAFVDEQIDMIDDAIAEAAAEEGENSWTVKDLVKLKERRRDRLEALLDRRKDEVLTFEEMGVDAILVDEVHAYKRSEFYTRLNKVKGIDNGSSQRSTSLILKSEHVREKTGGKNVITATGTPISNTLAELWTMLRYVRPDLLEQYRVSNFDDFASTFGEVVEDTEETASGFKEVERFSRYINGPELLSMFFSGADVRLTKDADLRLPNIKGGGPQAMVNEKSPELTTFIKDIIERWRAWEHLTGREKRKQMHVPLQLYKLAEKAAVDMRLVDPDYYEDEPTSKVNQCANKVAEIWKETSEDRLTQIVFLDMINDNAKRPKFNLHKDLKAKLVERGIPADEIELFSLEDNEKKLAAIKDRIRSGASRVIIGTTARLGIGVDIADKMVAAHHVNVPNRPMDIEQRDGRIWRQSNNNPEIQIYHYTTKDTLDSVMFNRLMIKQRGSDQVLTGDIDGRDFDDPYSEEQATFAEFAAASSGKAGKLLFEKNSLIAKEKKLKIAEQAHIRKVSEARRALQSIPENIEKYESELERAEQVKAYVEKDFPDTKFEDLTIDGETMPRAEAYKVLNEKIGKQVKQWEKDWIGMPMGDFRKNAPQGMYGPQLVFSDKLTAGDFTIRVEVDGNTNYRQNEKPSTKLKWYEGWDHESGEDRVQKLSNASITFTYKGRRYGNGVRHSSNALGAGITRAFNKQLARALELPDLIRESIAKSKKDLAEFENISKEKFRYKEELGEARRRIAEINRELTTLDADELANRGATSEEEAAAPRSKPMKALFYPEKPLEQARADILRDYKNGIMRVLADQVTLTRNGDKTDSEDLDYWKQIVGRAKQTPKGIQDATYEFINEAFDITEEGEALLDKLRDNAQRQINEAQMVATIGEPMAPGIPQSVDKDLPKRLPYGVTRFALGRKTFDGRRAMNAMTAGDARNLQKAMQVVRDALRKSGLPAEAMKHIEISLKPIIDLRGKDVEETVRQWTERKQTVSAILGATTFRELNALMELSLEQDLATMERTAYHEALHVLARWVLPASEYDRLMVMFKGNEESAADAFAEFMAGRSQPTGWTRRAFIKLRDLLRRVGNALRGAGFNTPEDIFGKLVSQEYGPGQRAGSNTTAVSFKAEERAEKWYSQMVKHLEAKLPGKGSAIQIAETIQSWAEKGQIKAEELKWSGLMDFLADKSDVDMKGKVTKQEILDYLAANHVRVQEVAKGGAVYEWRVKTIEGEEEDTWSIQRRNKEGGTWETVEENYDDPEDAADQMSMLAMEQEGPVHTKFSEYQLPGGENYRELLLTLPVTQSPERIAFDEFKQRMQNKYITAQWLQKLTAEEELERERLARDAAMSEDKQYQSSHWEEPNVLAHVRFNERTGPDGERILFLEEIQSDWHQAGRKRGYIKRYLTTQESIELGELETKKSLNDAEHQRLEYLQDLAKGEIPDAPFKKTWPMLAFNRMVRFGSEHGFDAIAWTPGEVQADRYDLSKHVDSVVWFDDTKQLKGFKDGHLDAVIDEVVEAKDLENYVGKDIAEKLIERPGNELRGEDLKVGGAGMRGFYDQILPAMVAKYFGKKAWGKAKVGMIQLGRNKGQIDLVKKMRHPEQFEKDQQPTVWSLPITPEMRKKALAEGMTMFKVDDKKDVAGQVFPEGVAQQIKAARGLQTKAPLKERMAEWIKTAFMTFRPGQLFPQMPNKYFAAENDILRRFIEVSSYARSRAVMELKDILNPKEMSPAQYDLFTYKLVVDDLLKDIELSADPAHPNPLENWKEDFGELPFGFKSVEEVAESKKVIDAAVETDETIKGALERRQKVMKDLRAKLVKERLLHKSVLKDDRYFHHQVLQYANERYKAGTGSRDVRTRKKGWQIQRIGSIAQYNTEYLQSEFEVLAQGYSQLETKRILDEVDRESNIIKDLRSSAKSRNLSRYYTKVSKMLAHMGITNENGTPIHPGEIEGNKDLDPLFGHRQAIAMSMSNLQAMAFKDKLSVPPEFDHVVDDLALRHEAKKAAEDDMPEAPETYSGEGAFWNFLKYLVDTGAPGSEAAATIFKNIQDRNQTIKSTLGRDFVTWKSEMAEKEPRAGSKGWVEWRPRPGTAWYLTNSINDKLLERVLAGQALAEEDIHKVLARGFDVRWVLPAELAEVLDGKEFLDLPQDNVVAKLAEDTMSWWKRWILINPFRIVKYNLNNLSGDFDIALAYDPKILKHTKAAAKDLWAWHYNKAMAPATKAEFKDAMKWGVIGSGMTVHDIPNVSELAEFDQLMSAMRADKVKGIAYVKKFWQGSKNFTTWRENVLRLAAYRHFQQQLRQGKRVYGASDPAKVDAVKNEYRKAALLARELVGDYGALSKGGRWMRKKMIPFYSWMEINAPRYWRIFKNLPIEGEAKGRKLRIGGALAKKGTLAVAKMAMFYGMVQLFNHLVWPDEEEELGEMGRRQLHLILGRRPDGSIITLRIQGAFSDALSWIGAEDLPGDIREVRAGRKPWYSLLSDAAYAPANRLAQGARPDVKLPYELATGKQLYPEFTKPRAIRDKWEHLARTFSMDPIYRHLAGRPAKGDGIVERILEDLARTVTYSGDPGEMAYHSTRRMAYDYLEQQNIERPAADPTDRSNALYYYRRAIQWGDTEAAIRYLKAYLELGGTMKGLKVSVKRAHPLAALPKAHRIRFMAWANTDGRETIKNAINWYNKVY